MKEMGSDSVIGEAVGLLIHSHWPSSIIGIWAVICEGPRDLL